MQLELFAKRTNEITITITKKVNGVIVPEVDAAVQVSITDDGATIPGSSLLLTNNNDGTYYGKWGMMSLKKRPYCFHVVVTIGASTVIDEDFEVIPQ
jgi:hypothetical protein